MQNFSYLCMQRNQELVQNFPRPHKMYKGMDQGQGGACATNFTDTHAKFRNLDIILPPNVGTKK